MHAKRTLLEQGWLEVDEYVADRELEVLHTEDDRDLPSLAGLTADRRTGRHFARRCEDGWEFGLVIASA